MKRCVPASAQHHHHQLLLLQLHWQTFESTRNDRMTALGEAIRLQPLFVAFVIK